MKLLSKCKLKEIYIDNCLNLTPLGVNYIFENCKELKVFFLAGIKDYYCDNLINNICESKLQYVTINNIDFIKDLNLNLPINRTIKSFRFYNKYILDVNNIFNSCKHPNFKLYLHYHW